jgi:leucyl-tRNA synthetase
VRTPLNRAKDWVTVTLDLGDGPKQYTRETNTMPNWAGSCWYYLRYLDPNNDRAFVDKKVDQYWMGSSGCTGGVDLYVGGVEHAVLHLLYARFWHKVLFDLGHVSTPEPFQRLFNQGYIQEYAFKDAREMYVDAFKVTDAQGRNFMEFKNELKEAPGPFLYNGTTVTREYGKMGKSLKNAISPDEMFGEFGCDTLRVYEMSMGPLEASKPWNTRDISGAYRFLQKVWRNLIDENTGVSRCVEAEAERGTLRTLHKTIIGVRRDMENLGFNTVVSKLIELNNHLGSLPAVPVSVAAPLILMLQPLAPHLAEELWHRVMRMPRHADAPRQSILHERFPIADEALAADDEIEIPVSIMGKLRSKVMVPAGSDAKAIEAAALNDPRVKELIEGKPIKKVIVVPGKMVNFVLG